MKRNEWYEMLPGKTDDKGNWLPVFVHLEDAASSIRYLTDHRVPDSVIRACGMERIEFRKICVFLAMVHDVGKGTPLFAAKILPHIPGLRERLSEKGADPGRLSDYLSVSQSPHARAGEAILEKLGCPDGVCAVVGAHHGKPTTQNEKQKQQLQAYSRNYYGQDRELWEEAWGTVLENALTASGYSTVEELPVLSNCAQMLLCGVLIQADWIASNQDYFPLISADDAFPESGLENRAASALSRLALPKKWNAWGKMADCAAFFTERFGFMPNPMQKRAAEIAASVDSGCLMIIEAQMGTGKTEAAMAAAELLSGSAGCGGVFFGLPTQATSNGIFPRVTAWAEKLSKDNAHSIRLVHGMAALNDEYRRYSSDGVSVDGDTESGLIAHSWFVGKKQALLADFVVGTVDTALMAALTQKHVMLRHLGLCGKAVIIDECHAYDAYMSRFLDRMLCWLGSYGVPVILLSATLPPDRKIEMLKAYTGNRKLMLPDKAGYPLITWTDGEKAEAEAIDAGTAAVSVGINRLEEEKLEADIRDRMKDGGCAGIIVNTVRRAQEIGERLRKGFPDHRVYVYHAQFLAEERIRREKELMEMIGKHATPETRSGVIVVGTQVLEQSLDIDFDYLVTDLCPMDLLLQRIGRLHRHRRERPEALHEPECSVMCAGDAFEDGAKTIYGAWLLKQTKRYLPDSVLLPDDIPLLVEKVYEDIGEEEEDPAWEEYRNKISCKESRAGDWILPKPRKSTRSAANNSLCGMLDHEYDFSEKQAEASVRDGNASLDVLVLQEKEDGHVGFLPWISDAVLRPDTLPSEDECRKIALQRLRLPFALCCGSRMNAVINALEAENRARLAVWQDSPWIKGELILLLDRAVEKDLCGFHLTYSKDRGLIYNKKEEE